LYNADNNAVITSPWSGSNFWLHKYPNINVLRVYAMF